MRVEHVELRVIEMELVEPFETSFGREEKRPAIIVSAVSDGVAGWGECVAGSGPWYSYETIQTAWHVLSDYLIPSVLEEDLQTPEELPQRWSRVRGHPMAKAGLESALWDLIATLRRVSLSQLLGGTKDHIESGISIGIQRDVPALLKVIERRLDQGYRRVKLKIKPGWDVEIIKAARERFGEIPLMADANSAYSLKDLPIFQQLDEYGLMMIEQPFSYEDLVDHAELQRQIRTPVCLDESVKSPEDARRALQLGSCRIINIKPGRVGGPSNAKRIHDECLAKRVPVWCGGMLETGIGRAHNVALASLPGFTLPNDLSASDRYYQQDLIEPAFVLHRDGTLRVPTGAGIGVEIVEERLARVTVDQKVYTRGAH
ncbi:MAG: o-succinylbenzoate synthase [Candidatus Fraserbacteria bacterium RBG_16_55_9]|uniref:o-succinylbenzoate synthase n=1 Tax=Fraserbacteria sp. (strain RBG_16_55_9) TaxID=1817864 RepID=A0A1F5UPS5_FRAXR|nr:MAG: o-succinylbenzoate synthase [Candidatus Fraserbacteria bacterium RBG_16_55_9]